MSFIDQVLAARRVAPQEKLFNTPTGIRRDPNLLATGVVRPQVREGLLQQSRVGKVGPQSEASLTKAWEWGKEKVDTVLDKLSGVSDRREDAIDSVLAKEGGYQNNKKDTGNYEPTTGDLVGTNYGISAPVLSEYLGRPATEIDMKNISMDDVRKIYKENYYDRFNIEELPKELEEIVMHSVVLRPGGGINILQELLKQSGAKNTSGKNKGDPLDIDGKMGSNTKEAMKDAKFTKKQFANRYLSYLQAHNTTEDWNEFGKGWTNRFKDLSK